MTSQTPMVIKKYARQAKSVSRVGFDYSRQLLLNIEQTTEEFFQVLQFLSCT